MTVVEVLKAARARIVRGWCRCAEARGEDGYSVDPNDPAAVKWCMAGALVAEGWKLTDAPQDPASALLIAATGSIGYGDWNDEEDRTLEEVLAAYDKAISLAEAQP